MQTAGARKSTQSGVHLAQWQTVEGDIIERGLELPARRGDAPVLAHRSPWIRFLRRWLPSGSRG
jgi:hypothetical protein